MAGRLLKTHLPVDDNGMMILRYPQAMCRLEMTWTEAVPHKPAHEVILHGTHGTIIAGDAVTLYTRDDKDGETIARDALPAGEGNGAEHFVHCILSDTAPGFVTCADLSRHAQEIMEAGLISATNGIAMSLPIEDHLFREVGVLRLPSCILCHRTEGILYQFDFRLSVSCARIRNE